MLDRVASLLRISVPDNANEGLLLVSGTTVPADASSGYQTGCMFQHTDGGDGTALYVNEGTASSCSFKAITVAA